MTRGRVGLAAALVILASGCWPVPGQNADRTSYNPAETQISVGTVGSLGEDWTASVDAGGVQSAPVLSNQSVHVVDGNALYSFATSTGARRWKTTIVDSPPGFFSMGATFVEGDQVAANAIFHVLGGGGTTTMVDVATGEVDRQIGTGALQSVRSPNGAGVSITAGTDMPRWTYLVNVDLATGTSSSSLLDFAFVNAEITLGRHRTYEAGYGPLPPYGVFESPNPPASWQTFVQKGQGIRAFGAGSKSCLPEGTFPDPNLPFYNCGTWSTPLDGVPTAPVIGPDEAVVYTGTSAGTVYAVDAATGAVLWSAPVGAGLSDVPALANGRLYVPTGDGRLVVLDATGCDAATCAPLWEADTDGAAAQPAVANGVVFTGSGLGNLRAFAAAGCGSATCDALWSASTGSAIWGAPAVTGGRLYVGTVDGRLISYA